MSKTKKPLLFRGIKGMIRLLYPKMDVFGTEKLPQEPLILVGNHGQIHGPIACELFLPECCYTWCAGQMMHLRDVPAYAYQDFWSQKPKWTSWFYKLLSYLIAPISVVVFNHARTIGVYRDVRIINTFRQTVEKLQEGKQIVVFPEHDVKRNNIIYDFQNRFVDVAKMYAKRTGKSLAFVPMYISPKLRGIYLGTPIYYRPDAPAEEERRRICDYLMDAITEIGRTLPEHAVIPYRNIPKKDYPSNRQENAR